MKVDIRLHDRELLRLGKLASEAETLGADAVWGAETVHDPFVQATLIAQNTKKVLFGPGVAAAFSRSPMSLAYSAWSLQQLSNGRFVLGLGSQVKAHIVRRFGLQWAPPAAKMRDTVQALRAIWQSWATGERLAYEGTFYKLDMVNPHFTPDPIPLPRPRIFLAGVNEKMLQLAGQLADGLFIHPLHTTAYLREVLIPNVAAGAQAAGRQPNEVELACTVMVATGSNSAAINEAKEHMRMDVALYGGTRTYHLPMEMAGWGEMVPWLHEKLAAREFAAARSAITDEMLDTIGVVAPPDELGSRLKERYTGLVDRLSLMAFFDTEKPLIPWRKLIESLKG
ncbi:MAG: TIGR03617 family F420-dependent LLM class oxidoreductase [Chloroflexi bacterium]|nr:TIGR03617 family F420-dependent LLM class oxidoreductase [Chloroflexota bacterium]